MNLAGGKEVWLRAVSRREGDDVVTRCCVVTEGQVFPVEVRVNVPALVRQLRALGLPSGGDSVSGFGSFLKKAVKSITKNKIVKAVGKAAGKVVKSPVFAVVNPVAAIAVHTTKKAVTGKGTLKGAAGKVLDMGTAAAMAAAPGASKALPAIGAGALNFVSPKAVAALGVGLKTVQQAKAGAAVTGAARVALAAKNAGRLSPAQLKQLSARGPALAKVAVNSKKVQAAVKNIAAKAKAGSPEAKQAAGALSAASKALTKVAAVRTALSGGTAGLLLLPNGKIVRAPKGKFAQSSASSAQAGTLYQGAGAPALRGRFTAVSGQVPYDQNHSPGWGGPDDPENDTDAPLYPLRHPGGRVELTSWWTP